MRSFFWVIRVLLWTWPKKDSPWHFVPLSRRIFLFYNILIPKQGTFAVGDHFWGPLTGFYHTFQLFKILPPQLPLDLWVLTKRNDWERSKRTKCSSNERKNISSTTPCRLSPFRSVLSINPSNCNLTNGMVSCWLPATWSCSLERLVNNNV